MGATKNANDILSQCDAVIFSGFNCCLLFIVFSLSAAGSRSSSVGGPTSQSSSNNMSSGAKPFQNLFSRSSSTKPDKRELFIKDTKSGVFFFEPPAEVSCNFTVKSKETSKEPH